MPQGLALNLDRPRVFIGSSSEGKEIAQRLQAELLDFCDAELWTQGFFPLGDSNVESLLLASAEVDYAVLVLTPDSLVQERGTEGHAPRANVIFELGLFTGALGRHSAFAVYCADDKVVIPSDWSVTSAVYRRPPRGNISAALAPATLAIRDAIKRAEERKSQMKQTGIADGEEVAVRARVVRYAHDALETFGTGVAGVRRTAKDEALVDQWVENVLGMIHDLFEERQADVYLAWLRPRPSSSRRLSVYWQRNLPDNYNHYEYTFDEGLVGKVWSKNTPAAVSEMRTHSWWVYREGCDNVSYLAAPVGKADGTGGVLAVGSDAGFIVTDGDLEALVVMADVLALAVDLPIRRRT
jgi:CAP12/Pycsar effector protein, TIR domain